DRRGVEVLARALAAVPVGARVAGGEVDEPELRVDRRRLPDRRAAPQVLALRPRARAGIAGAGGRVPAPALLAARGVELLHERARAVLGADDADVDLPVRIEGGGGDRLSAAPVDEVDLPVDLARPLVERDDRA